MRVYLLQLKWQQYYFHKWWDKANFFSQELVFTNAYLNDHSLLCLQYVACLGRPSCMSWWTDGCMKRPMIPVGTDGGQEQKLNNFYYGCVLITVEMTAILLSQVAYKAIKIIAGIKHTWGILQKQSKILLTGYEMLMYELLFLQLSTSLGCFRPRTFFPKNGSD